MSEITVSILLMAVLFALLAGGVWVGLTLAGVAWVGMEFFAGRPAGDAMAMTIWGSAMCARVIATMSSLPASIA